MIRTRSPGWTRSECSSTQNDRKTSTIWPGVCATDTRAKFGGVSGLAVSGVLGREVDVLLGVSNPELELELNDNCFSKLGLPPFGGTLTESLGMGGTGGSDVGGGIYGVSGTRGIGDLALSCLGICGTH